MGARTVAGTNKGTRRADAKDDSKRGRTTHHKKNANVHQRMEGYERTTGPTEKGPRGERGGTRRVQAARRMPGRLAPRMRFASALLCACVLATTPTHASRWHASSPLFLFLFRLPPAPLPDRRVPDAFPLVLAFALLSFPLPPFPSLIRASVTRGPFERIEAASVRGRRGRSRAPSDEMSRAVRARRNEQGPPPPPAPTTRLGRTCLGGRETGGKRRGMGEKSLGGNERRGPRRAGPAEHTQARRRERGNRTTRERAHAPRKERKKKKKKG